MSKKALGIVHFNKEVVRPTQDKHIAWDELKTNLRHIFNLTGTQEILAVAIDEEGLAIAIKDHGRDSSTESKTTEAISGW